MRQVAYLLTFSVTDILPDTNKKVMNYVGMLNHFCLGNR